MARLALCAFVVKLDNICGVQYTQTHNVVLYNGFSVYYFGFYVKSHGVYLSLYFLVFVM